MKTIRQASLLASAAFCSIALAQPSGDGPLNPPANGMRRADPTWIALHDCTAHVDPLNSIEHATVVIKAGRIIAVLPGDKGPDGIAGTDDDSPARIPLGPRIIPSTGMHVYAGFIDSYVEVDAPLPVGDSRGMHWNPKVTPQRNATDAGAVDQGLAASMRQLGFTAAVISPRDGVFRGQGALVSLAKPSDEPSADKPPVYKQQTHQAIGFDTGGGYPSSLMGAIALIRQTFSDADFQASRRRAGAVVDAPNCVDLLSKDAPKELLWDCTDELNVLRASKILKEFDRRAIMIGSGSEYQRLEAIKSDALQFILPLNFPRTPDVSDIGKVNAVELKTMMEWEQAPTNPRRLYEAGIEFALTTHRMRDRNEFFTNLRMAIAAGYPEQEALSALTTLPAKRLGVDTVMGTISIGSIANLAVFDGPVFDRHTKHRATWVDGVEHTSYVEPVEIDGRWDLTVTGAAQADRWLEINSTSDVTIHRNDKSVKATKVTYAEGVLSFMFDHEPLDGKAGMFLMSGAITTDAAKEAATFTGRVARPDGTFNDFVATRRKPDPLSKFAGAYSLSVAAGFASPITIVVKEIGEQDAKSWKAFARRSSNAEFVDAELQVVRVSKRTMVLDVPPAAAPWTLFESARIVIDRNNSGGFDAVVRVGGASTSLKVQRRDRIETESRGVWSVIKQGDRESNDDQLTIEIKGDEVTLVLREKETEPVTIKATDVKIDGARIQFSHSLEAWGITGDSKDTVIIDGDVMSGSSDFPDGEKHTYLAVRKDDKKEKDRPEFAWRLDGVARELPTPFGPYGFVEQPRAVMTVINNVTVWTGVAGRINGATVIINDGRIAFVGTGEHGIRIDSDAQIIDGAGMHLTAGIIDAHSHTGISGGVNEGAQAITSEVRIQDVTNPDAISWYRQLASGVTSVLSLHGSANAIGGQSQVVKIRWGSVRPEDMHFENAKSGIKFALGENPTGKNGDGGNGGQYPVSRMGVEMIIRDRFIVAKEYMSRPTDPDRRRDLELEAIAEILRGDRLIHCHSYRQDEIVMLCRIAEEYGIKIGTFQHILEGYKVADDVRDHSGGGSGFADWWAYKLEVQDAIPQGLPLMYDVGANVSFNSDSDELARRLNTEAAKAVKYGGLSEEEAMNFVTLNPAKQLHVDDRVGSVEQGKVADLALWSGSPLSSMSKCVATWVDGVKLFSIEQDAAMRAGIVGERQRLIQRILAGPEKKRSDDGGARADGGRPGAGREGGRRRRRPEDEVMLERVREALLREHYLGGVRDTRGVCGCGLEHEAYREE
jgi:imidazolonepropionase-like amidohydrolase